MDCATSPYTNSSDGFPGPHLNFSGQVVYSKQDFQQNGKIVSKKFCIFASFSLKTFHFLGFFRRKKIWENFTKENFCKMSHFFPKFSFARNPNSKAPYFCVQTSNSGSNSVEQSTFLDTSDLC